jgi:L-ascorbate metabolism protein UlaG (beta-lactamase superfamily)
VRITKLAHSCLLVEERGLRILADPGGTYFTLPDDLEDIDVVLITHQHADHYDQNALEKILRRSPNARIFTNKGVGALLSKANTSYSLLEDGGRVTVEGVTMEAFGSRHATLLHEIPVVDNTGYLIADRLFLSGDALTVPSKQVEILAVPLAGPWLRLSEAVEYAGKVSPRHCFPIHEAVLREPLSSDIARWAQKSFEAIGTKYLIIEPGNSTEI